MQRRILIALPFLALLTWSATRPRSTRRVEPDVAVEELAWMAGTWERVSPDEQLVETWAAPVGDAVLGMFQWTKRGKTTLYEFMSVEEDGEHGLVFRLRHFNRGLEPWVSEAQGSLTYPLHSLGDEEVIFENPEQASPRRFVYRRKGERLWVRLEPPEGEAWVFEYRLVGSE